MKKIKVTFCILLFISLWGYAQPGYFKFDNNLNNFTNEHLNEIKSNPGWSFITFQIDSTTHFKNLDLIKDFKKLNLNIYSNEFPKEFNRVCFKNLKKIKIDSQNLIKISPLSKLTSLKEITINGLKCSKLENEFSYLENLKKLEIVSDNINNIEILKKLNNLRSLTLNCKRLKKIPRFTRNTIKRLNLTIGKNTKIKNLRFIKSLDTLSFNKSLFKSIPDFFPSNLKVIYINDNNSLESIENLNLYDNLKSITINKTGLSSIKGNFIRLTPDEISIIENDFLTNIDDLFSIKSIREKLRISYNRKLKSINFKDNCFQINEFYLSYNDSLEKINSNYNCSEVRKINIFGNNFKGFPAALAKLKNLTYVDFSEKKTIDISHISSITSLKTLKISCAQIDMIPESLYSNTNIESIDISHCKKITDLSKIIKFKKLNSLSFFSNDKLEKIPDIEYLKSMDYLSIMSNKKLKIKDNYSRGNNWSINDNYYWYQKIKTLYTPK